ncbi:AAA family ATPase [Pseudarthrobacter sp. efr-133-R2A-89]|uniref:ATP-dependent nuclease n=1 Tax=Pseudarthrobacter sp. efr-133-R2A-89 TaxID=3040302 RepID=UPI0025539213|nr:AAA family ATPase [Pseudarthrobacter sp. efr-133-R2A-89]
MGGLAKTIPKLASDWATERHSQKGWPKFLESVKVNGIRGWSGQMVEFRFPVVAIAGENGAGKSTVLKAAASAYSQDPSAAGTLAQTFSPDDFFPTTPWEIVSGAQLTYLAKQGASSFPYHVRKHTKRWRGMPERPKRPVFFLDISRTQPIDTLIGYGRLAVAKMASGNFSAVIDDEYLGVLSRVLDRTYDSGEIVQSNNKQVGVLATSGRKYSNFHQGAGEDATADLVALLQNAPRHSLVIIDEVEASLHPRAQRRLMTELIGLAQKNRLQIIVSTHSQYVLEQLPPEARLVLTTDEQGIKEVIYGATTELALSLMDDEVHPELILYCEDEKAEYLVHRFIDYTDPDSHSRLAVVIAGPASSVKTLGLMADQGRLPGLVMGVLDGDQNESPGCAIIPGGTSPERAVYEGLSSDGWRIVAERLGVREGDLVDAWEHAQRIPEKHHVWTERIAEKLPAHIRKSRIWEAACDVWIIDMLPEEVRNEFVGDLLQFLPPVSRRP